jgi:hypothetical protein
MVEEEIIQSYHVGLQRTKNPAKHLHNMYRDLFGQPFHKANLLGMYKVVKEFGAEIVFHAICDLNDWSDFVPTRNVTPLLYTVSKRRFMHKEQSENQPETVNLTSYLKELASVRTHFNV